MPGKWIEFEQRPHQQNNEGYISLNDRGEFLMNDLLFEKFGRPEAVTLHFDPDDCRIELQISEANRVNAIRIRERQGAWAIRSLPFLRKWDIQLKGTYFFPDLQIENDMLVLPLNTRFKTSFKRR